MSGVEFALAIAGFTVGVPSLVTCCLDIWDQSVRRLYQLEEDPELYRDISRITQSQAKDLLQFFHTYGENLSVDFQDELHSMFRTLRDLFEDLSKALPTPTGNPPKIKLSRKLRSQIKEIVKRMEEWSDRFLKRAIVVLFFGAQDIRAPKDEVEKAIRSYKALEKVARFRTAVQTAFESDKTPTKLLLDKDDLPSHRTQLPQSSLWVAGDADTPPASYSLVEYRQYSEDADTTTINGVRKIVREIASALREADSKSMGILGCNGFCQDDSQNRFELHFPLPEGQQNPRTLQSLLTDPSNKKYGKIHPLNHRLNLAKKIASAVFFVHSGGFVHKNIRPENIIIFERTVGVDRKDQKYHQFPRALGEPYLVGYDGIRKVDATSNRIRIEDWRKTIYLSPVRHRLNIGDEYKSYHDVYSLGVVLLEVALWTTMTSRQGVGKELWADGSALKPAVELQKTFIKLAKSNVPQLLGQKYTDVVVACLEELKHEEQNGLLQDQDGVVVELAYITEVMKRLEEISV